MKKIIIFLLAVMLLAVSCGTHNHDDGQALFNGNSALPNGDTGNSYDEYGYLEGHYLFSTNGSHMIVADNYGPCVMSAADGVSFDELTDGDRIRVKTGVILESYPGQLTAYSLEKLSDGERSDIDKETLKSLAELGWTE